MLPVPRAGGAGVGAGVVGEEDELCQIAADRPRGLEEQ